MTVVATTRSSRTRITRYAVAAVGAFAVVVALLWLGVALSGASGRIPPGVEIDGVRVGGASRDEARRRLLRHVDLELVRPIVVHADGTTVETSGTRLGADARVEDALDTASGGGLRAYWRWVTGRDTAIPLTYDLDPAALTQLEQRASGAVGPVDAGVVVRPAGIDVRPAQPGSRVDTAPLRTALGSLPRKIDLPEIAIAPDVRTEAAEAAARDLERLTENARTIDVRGAAFVLTPRELRGLATVVRRGDRLVPMFDAARLAQRVPVAAPPSNARFRVDGDRVTVVPAQAGYGLDAAATAAELARTPAQTVVARLTLVEPQTTTAALEALHIRELVSSFTTFYPPGQPRVLNIKRAAEVLDGTLLRPGATFSMNGALGERTLAKGYVPAPSIAGNSFVDSVGGGISQVATTLYNAAFFAGLELVAHQPHSLYIDRYPLGREATISWGGPELIFRNDWPAGLLMKVIATDTSIAARFYSSSLGRRVVTATSPPHDLGGGALSVDYTRRVYRGDRLLRDERHRTQYAPSPSHARSGR